MLLFQGRFHGGLVSGAVTLTFRAWDKPKVKAGGRYRCHPIGVLEVDDVRQVRAREIPEADARRAGFASKREMLDYLGGFVRGGVRDDTTLWRVALRHAGDGDRVEGAMDAHLSHDDVEAIRARLSRLDAKRPWTAQTLALIGRRPREAASGLAAEVGRETAPFKADVVKLKKLGLTQSFEVGYEVTPRGRAFLEAAGGAGAPSPRAGRPERAAGKAPAKRAAPRKR